MIETMKKQNLKQQTRQGAPAPTSYLRPILAGAPYLDAVQEGGLSKNYLT